MRRQSKEDNCPLAWARLHPGSRTNNVSWWRAAPKQAYCETVEGYLSHRRRGNLWTDSGSESRLWRTRRRGRTTSGSPVTMAWPFGSSSSGSRQQADEPAQPSGSWPDALENSNQAQFSAAKEWAPIVLYSLVGLGALQLYANYLRRIPGAAYIRPAFFRNRSLFGKVTSVGDGDNFHLFHTPGGRAVGWGWLRKVPDSRRELKDRTVSSTQRHSSQELSAASPSSSLG